MSLFTLTERSPQHRAYQIIGWVVGIGILIYRRRTTGPVFIATTRNDKLMYVVLVAAIVAGAGLCITGTLGGCNNAGEGALSGAGIGALAGMGLGALSGHMGSGAAAGAILGGIGGMVLGDQNSRR